jgi:hypothetical protein
MALTLAENFGIYVDHYVINMVTLTCMVMMSMHHLCENWEEDDDILRCRRTI